MLILIDIGNTNITLGISDDNAVRNISRVNTRHPEAGADYYQKVLTDLIESHNMPVIKGAVVCSVVSEVTPFMHNAVKERCNITPIIVDHTIKSGLRFRINNIHALGADRIVNAAAAHHLYKGDVMVIDFGTATTFCAITEEGDYLGGAIMPGLGISAESLKEKTSGLPLVELKAPESVPGIDTTDNILTGLLIGHAGAAERIIHDISKKTKKTFSVIATGGYTDLVSPFMRGIDYINPSLTLEGLRIIYTLNC
jgi:type III pantothenate kinase